MAAEQLKNDLKNQIAKRSNVPAKTKFDEVKDYINLMLPEFRKVLPKHLSPERLGRIALTTIRLSPKLQGCKTPSLMGAILNAAAVGLEPGIMGQCYLVPYGDEAQLIIGYQGLIELFYRSGKVITVYADSVCMNDKFDYKFGIDERLDHIPASGDRGEITHFYAYCKMIQGAYRFVVLTKTEVDNVRDRYSKAKSGSSPWITNYKEMGCKTAVRTLSKWLPKSVEIQQALSVDDTVKTDPFKEDSVPVEAFAIKEEEAEQKDSIPKDSE